MKIRLLNSWHKLQATFWFLPSLMVVSALALSFVMISLDQYADRSLISRFGWIYTNKPEGARAVLSTIAGSMITVAGVVFSITIVALSLASSQFGPRLLRNFMRDTGNQVVLGTFIATFFYCLLILRTIRSGEETLFVPHLSVAVGVLLAICSLAVLIYFIHHVSESIQASSIITRVDRDLGDVMKRLFPVKLGEAGPAAAGETPEEQLQRLRCQPLRLDHAGYLQAIDQETLLTLCSRHDLTVKLLCKPGDYLVIGQAVAEIYAKGNLSTEVPAELANTLILGKERTQEQDILFPINQLVEIALRALSPGINDPFTASACLDRLTNGLCQLAARTFPSSYRKDEQGQLRVIARKATFADALEATFSQIRIYARNNPALMRYLLDRQLLIAHSLRRPEDQQPLLQEATLTLHAALKGTDEPTEQQQLRAAFAALERVLKAPVTNSLTS